MLCVWGGGGRIIVYWVSGGIWIVIYGNVVMLSVVKYLEMELVMVVKRMVDEG